ARLDCLDKCRRCGYHQHDDSTRGRELQGMSWQVFHTTVNPTGQELDDNLSALTRMGGFPCTVSGSANAIVLTFADTNAPPLNAYQNYQEFVFIATGTSSSTVTIKVGALATLNAYKDTSAGPVVMASGEIVQSCSYIAMYDLALNGGLGGFHVRPGAVVTNTPINPSTILVDGSASTITAYVSNSATVSFTVIPANTTQDQVVTFGGPQPNDIVSRGLAAAVTAGLIFNARVPATGSVTLRAANITAASIAAFTLSPVHIALLRMVP